MCCPIICFIYRFIHHLLIFILILYYFVTTFINLYFHCTTFQWKYCTSSQYIYFPAIGSSYFSDFTHKKKKLSIIFNAVCHLYWSGFCLFGALCCWYLQLTSTLKLKYFSCSYVDSKRFLRKEEVSVKLPVALHMIVSHHKASQRISLSLYYTETFPTSFLSHAHHQTIQVFSVLFNSSKI